MLKKHFLEILVNYGLTTSSKAPLKIKEQLNKENTF
jgi:hypothetical protein